MGVTQYADVFNSMAWIDRHDLSTDPRYFMVGEVSGLYSMIQVCAFNTDTQNFNIDIYLLLAE